MIISKEYEPLEQYITHKIIPTFRTKKDAQKAAALIGWQQYHIEQIERKFEKVWIVAQHFMYPEEVCGIMFDVYSLPIFIWENKNGTQQMKIVKIKKLKRS